MLGGLAVLVVLAATAESLPQGDPCPGTCSCRAIAYYYQVNCTGAYMDHIPTMQLNTSSLYFSYNKLTALRNSTFKAYPNFLLLYLDNNRISYIEAGTFWNLHQLRMLYLDHNRIEVIPQNTFEHNSQLTWLDLSGNDLKLLSSGGLLTSASLQVLNLSSCNLGSLPKDLFQQTPKLEKLDLSNNQFRTVSVQTFQRLGFLAKLNLQDIRLTCDCAILPFHGWISSRHLESQATCESGLPWQQVQDLKCRVSVYVWVGVGVGAFVLLGLGLFVVCYVRARKKKHSGVTKRLHPPLPAIPVGEYIDVVAEKKYESIKRAEVTRYTKSLVPSCPSNQSVDGPVYVNAFVPPKKVEPTYDDVQLEALSPSPGDQDSKRRCMSLVSILKDCDYYETVE